jgi:hypothetical protein
LTDEDYKRTLEAAENELADLLLQKSGLDDRISKLRESIVALSKLVGDDLGPHPFLTLANLHLREVGLTEAIRGILQNAKDSEPKRFLLPTEVRDRLKSAEFDLSKYKNEMAAITTILK